MLEPIEPVVAVHRRYHSAVDAAAPDIGTDDIEDLLVRMKLVVDLAVSVYAIWVLFDLSSRGKLSYLARWHIDRYRAQWRARRQWETSRRWMLWQANEIVRGALHG